MLDSTKKTINLDEKDLPRVSVTYQKRIDTADFGKNAITLSKTVTVSVLPDGNLNGDLAAIIKASALVEEELINDVNQSAAMLRAEAETAPTVSVTPNKTNPYQRRK